MIRCLLIFCLLFAGEALAGRGGHNTTFDPNLFGGSWTTINCTGVQATDDAALSSWQTAAIAANPAPTPLRLTGKCGFTPGPIFNGINNVVVWGYGATVPDIAIGAQAVLTSTTYFINTASVGDTSIVLQTAADASHFAVNNYMVVTAMEKQYPDCGFPPNPAFWDQVLITSITGTTTKTINFSPPLTNNYATTWPLVCAVGPASVYPLGANWQTNIQLFGLRMKSTVIDNITGKTISLVDCEFSTDGVNGNINPTLSGNIFISNSYIGSTEVDKLVNLIYFHNVNGGQKNWVVQSDTVKQFTIVNSSVKNLSGTPLNAAIINTNIIGEIAVGPLGYGSAKTLIVDGMTASTTIAGLATVPVSATSYSSGTISMALTSPFIGSFVHTGVPGFKYVLGDNHCPNCGTPQVAFTITNVRIDATNYYWDTDLLSVPSALCFGVPCPNYESFGAQTITQRFTPSVNVRQWAAP